jgi:hypothetical protein
MTDKYTDNRNNLLQTMELCILEEVEWRVMPRCGTTAGILFATGLLNGLPHACIRTLYVCILNSYDHVRIFPPSFPRSDEDCIPERERFIVMFQVRAQGQIWRALYLKFNEKHATF